MSYYTGIAIDSLPDEIMLMIFERVHWRDLIDNISLVSKKWFGLVEQTHRLRLDVNLAEVVKCPLRSYRNIKTNYITSNLRENDALLKLLDECRNLELGDIESHKELQNVLNHCKNLTCLSILNMRFVGTIEMSELAISKLNQLCLVGSRAIVVFETIVEKMKEMRKLSLHDVEISDKSVQQIITLMPHLKLMELNGVRGLTPAAFMSGDGLSGLAQLESLSLPASTINDEVIGKMKLARLQKLCLFKQKDLQTTKLESITKTLAANCPLLNEVYGTGNTVRFSRDPITSGIFQAVFDSAETNSSIDPDDQYRLLYVEADLDEFVDEPYEDELLDETYEDELLDEPYEDGFLDHEYYAGEVDDL